MTLDQITVNMDIIIRDEISEILSTKPEDQRYLNYLDMRQVCSTIKRYCCDSIGEIPQEVEMACCFAEAVLAPDKKRKKEIDQASRFSRFRNWRGDLYCARNRGRSGVGLRRSCGYDSLFCRYIRDHPCNRHHWRISAFCYCRIFYVS